MKIKELAEKLNLQVAAGASGLDNEITGGYASDLLSDVMGKASAGQVWITLHTHKNIMAVASLRDLAAIVLVKDATPDADTLAQADAESIPLLLSNDLGFELCGKIYQLLND